MVPFKGALKWRKPDGTRENVDGGESEQLEHQPWQPAMASIETSYSLLYARADLGSTSRV
jgi:hypothetical protein